MGIFDKKKGKRGDEFDSPVEQIDLSAPPTSEAEAVEAQDDVGASNGHSERSATAEAVVEPERPRPRAPTSNYGIEQAIALMRTLPQDNIELVVQVVKHTLESTKIDLTSIIADATDKQERIDKRIRVLKDEIADLQNEISTRSREISDLEADNKETSMVKERLQLAENLGKDGQPAGKPGPGLGSARARTPTSIPPVGNKTTVVMKK